MEKLVSFTKEELIDSISTFVEIYGFACYCCDERIKESNIRERLHDQIAFDEEEIAIQWAEEEGFKVKHYYNSCGVREIQFYI